VTESLVSRHPLRRRELLDAVQVAWDTVWRTTIGADALAIPLGEVDVPATVVGYFFEVLLARELGRRHPSQWRGNQSKDEKDLVYLPDGALSIEVKTSGQHGFSVYGNRSVGQNARKSRVIKKEKSGYYLTVNFVGQVLTFVRFGWIDADDWIPQGAPSGQMAALKPAVYQHKLLPLLGSYRQRAPVILLEGVGPSTAAKLEELGIRTIGDLPRCEQLPDPLARIRTRNQAFLDGCMDCASDE
jgi:hypothetical protein